MTSCNDNKVTTILLLCALGFLIYYLTTSDSARSMKENFNSVFFNTSNVPSNLPNYQADEKPMFKNNKIDNYPADYQMGNERDDSMNQNIANNSASYNPQPQMPIPMQTVQSEMADGPTILKPPASDVVNGYDGFDGTGANVASVGAAFGKLVDDKAFTPDRVNLNNSEMKNFNNKDFLPKEIIPGAFDDFSQSKYNIEDDKLINTERYIIGINTVGQSLKNGSHDIRGTIANPKFSISPWNNSTYEPDYNIKPLC
jgi:hypothetical protein